MSKKPNRVNLNFGNLLLSAPLYGRANNAGPLGSHDALPVFAILLFSIILPLVTLQYENNVFRACACVLLSDKRRSPILNEPAAAGPCGFPWQMANW